MLFFIYLFFLIFLIFIFLGLLLEQGCPCLGSLLALNVYVPVCILVIFFVSQINWIGLDWILARYIRFVLFYMAV